VGPRAIFFGRARGCAPLVCHIQAHEDEQAPTRRLAAAAQARDIPPGALGMDSTSARACLTPHEWRGPRPRSRPQLPRRARHRCRRPEAPRRQRRQRQQNRDQRLERQREQRDLRREGEQEREEERGWKWQREQQRE